MKMKYLILGAGPSGLTLANRLKQMGETSFFVLEKEKEAGGLCRSTQVDGSPFDIGGGHFLDVRRPKVNEFLFQFMPEEEWENLTETAGLQSTEM
ncbi:MAG: NAD(P)-binding protein [Mediterraneibacter gnavus]